MKKTTANTQRAKQKSSFETIAPWFGLGVFLLCFALMYCRQINFSAADLGRHIKNGEILLTYPKVLTTNLFSYTLPNYSFINHHWFAGLIFFFIYSISGFGGLHIVFVLIMLTAMALLFSKLKSNANWQSALLIGIALLPMLAYRREIRPEGFSYLFLLLWLNVISNTKLELKTKLIYAGLIQLAWVNTHIFFFIGPMITAIYGLSALVNKQNWKSYLGIFSLQSLVCLANPNFLKGALSPLTIFNHYGYMVSENQSVFFMQDRFGLGQYIHVEIVVAIFTLGLIWVIVKSDWKDILPELLLAFTGIAMGLAAIRGFTYLGITVAIALSAIIAKMISFYGISFNNKLKYFSIGLSSIFVLVGLSSKGYVYSYKEWNTGIGLTKGSNKAGEFFNKASITGPIFNNYDIGSYLIFHHFPNEKVFTDNRPEAYSVAFFDSIYNPALKQEKIWLEMEKKYNFNCIYFYRHDNTEFGQPFLIRRIQDNSWIPVFVDDYNIILLKNKPDNSAILNQYAIDKSIFGIIPQ